ncbi:20586_t:CDS:1, partial [Gigaspora margarita]
WSVVISPIHGSKAKLVFLNWDWTRPDYNISNDDKKNKKNNKDKFEISLEEVALNHVCK